ncbi:MAG TPA: phosphoribosyltransferase family protein, partial [Thermoanaerobaculia bacterium]|nr:phosphoribosyltransferase family protein [Thermoanaerobaculia bacterium]
SMREVFNYIESRGAAKVKTATFLDKPKARKVPFHADYVGFAIEPQFVIGYGLDFAEKYRNIPEVQVLSD